MELANAVSSTAIKKNITTTSIGNVQDKQDAPQQYKPPYNKNFQHIKVKPFPFETESKVQDTGSRRKPLEAIGSDTEVQHLEMNQNNGVLSNERERELENEILKLKEELKKYQESSVKKEQSVDYEVLEDYEERPISKKSFWSRRESQTSKSKFR
ncbi:hypothetical protein X975_15772, partial [Stegodyphus mimosarum]